MFRAIPLLDDYAEITDYSIAEEYRIMFDVDSDESVLSGAHFSFDLAVDSDAIMGSQSRVYMTFRGFGDEVYLKVVPEPTTMMLFGFGGLALLKSRKK